MNTITAPAVAKVTGAPFVELVDLDGGPVPIWEKDAPIVPPFDPDEETDPETWPDYYDNWRYVPTDADVQAMNRAFDEDEDSDLLAPVLESEAAGLVEGAFVPSDDDWNDYAAWSRELDARRASAAYLDNFNAARQDWSEVPA